MLLCAKVHLRTGAWRRQMADGLTGGMIASIGASMRTATELAPAWAKAWHQWAYFNVEAMIYFNAANDPAAAQRFVAPAVSGFFRSIELGQAAPANSLAAVEAGARQIECTINGLGERAGNTALEEVVMALKVRHDIMPYTTGIDTTKIMGLSRRVAQASGFVVQPNKAIVGKNAFLHESGIHQDGVLKNVETFEIMRPADIGLNEANIAMGKHSGRAALRAKLRDLGYEVGDNQLKDVFVRFKALADRKKEIYDDDLVALMQDSAANTEHDYLQVKHLRVVCGSDGQSADLTMSVGGEDKTVHATGDGPVDACFNAVKAIWPHDARLQLYQVHAVTEGTDAQATVSVRMEEDGRIVNGQAADTDTILASVKAYVGALNHLIVRRARMGKDSREISMYSH